MTTLAVKRVAPSGSQTLLFSREFDAPASLVFRAHVDADLIPRWIGPRGTTLRMRTFDARTGGGWSYVVEGRTNSWAFFGSFHEVVAPSRLVWTWEYEGDPGSPNMEVLTFVDLPGGRCRIDGRAVYLSEEERDATMNQFEGGRDTDFERLDELLPSLT
jgi:uncharacterized protein YndB with AHSA1/START domain